MKQKEKLEEARRLYKDANADQRYVLERLFPELAESDDEKIISAIRKAIEAKVENLGNGVTRTACLAWLEKQGEPIDEEKVDNQNCVKPSVKGEPKFKVGDYVVDNCGYVWRIEGIINQFYILEGIDGGESRPTIEWVNKTFHLWDITEDAKNGDVLVHGSFMFDDFIFIYDNTSILQAYCYYSNEINRFIIEDRGHHCPWNMQEVTPASKEQRDKFEKAMAESGYEFDFDKKELKKIENEEYDGEDYGIDSLWHAKNILEKTLGKVDGYQTDDGILDHKCAISAVNKLCKEDAKITNRWNPSDEHIHWLKWVINRMPDTEKANEAEVVLKDLLEQLEEL